jgi:HEAT repeat protein
MLHAPEATLVRAVREELTRRGHAPLEIYLQERLTDSDPRVRSQAAASLPGMPAMDARPWLLSLSRDEDTEVRLVALSLMATSGETQMLRRVKEMAQSDPDPRIRTQAKQIER